MKSRLTCRVAGMAITVDCDAANDAAAREVAHAQHPHARTPNVNAVVR